MIIPKQFVIHNQSINVIQRELDIEDNRYGYYDSVKEEIVIFHKIKSNGEIITLTQNQIEHTFWHEVFHAFQWHVKGATDEWEAQTYAGIMMEFIATSGIKINPNIIHEPIDSTYDE